MSVCMSVSLSPWVVFACAGADGAGVVEALGAGVSSVAVGDRVWLSGSISGTYAEYCVSKASDVHPLPPSIAFKEGAGIGTAYRTAYRGLFTRVKGLAKSGQTVLVHGASGGVGIILLRYHNNVIKKLFSYYTCFNIYYLFIRVKYCDDTIIISYAVDHGLKRV